MITFENVKVMNFEGALRGMRNPLNSWDRSDSYYGCGENPCSECGYLRECNEDYDYKPYIIGPNDLDLAQRLIKAGSDHRKFLRQIFVSVDITAPLYWWKEFDTYKVGTVANSCSTMHRLHYKPIEISDFSVDDVYLTSENFLAMFKRTVENCETLRSLYLVTKSSRYWRALIQLLPESYNQRRTITLNYENLRNIYGSRRNHKLDEWSIGFIDWISTLPYAEELIKS